MHKTTENLCQKKKKKTLGQTICHPKEGRQQN